MTVNRGQHVQPKGLSFRSARGLMYLLSGSIAAKLISIAAQIVLSYLLSDGDYGIVGLAFTITVFIQVIEQAGIGDVLIQRRRFRIWAIQGFWLALALGIVGCLLVMLSAPVASRIYRNDELFWVLMVLSLASIPNSLTVVPRAQLSRDFRFRALAVVNLANITLRMALTVLFAAWGFGPYSFVVPVPITSAALAAFFWWWVRPPWSLGVRPDKWRYLIGDSSRSLGGELGRAALEQSDYIVLGLFRSVEIVGLYYFGFMFSTQMLQLFMTNMGNILFPAFTKLNHQPHIQFQGFLKAQRILTMVGVSACLLQAAISEPLSELIFHPRWQPAIIVMQILSVGMATRMVTGSSLALLKSQGRFEAILWNRLVSVALQVIGLVAVLSMGGGLAAVAIVVAVLGSVLGPVTFYMAIRPYGGTWGHVVGVMSRPVVCGVVSVGAGWWIAQVIARAGCGNLAQLATTILVAVALNALLARMWMRPVWDDLWLRVRRLIPLRVAS